MQRTALLLLLSICQTTISQSAQASDTQLPAGEEEHPSVWINPGFHSYHFDRDRGYREANYGLGVQVSLSSTSSITGGEYLNSFDGHSRYLAWIWQPYQVGIARFGLWAGGIDGYSMRNGGGWFLAASPMVSLEYKAVGINFTIAPPQEEKKGGAFILQFKLRIWGP